MDLITTNLEDLISFLDLQKLAVSSKLDFDWNEINYLDLKQMLRLHQREARKKLNIRTVDLDVYGKRMYIPFIVAENCFEDYLLDCHPQATIKELKRRQALLQDPVKEETINLAKPCKGQVVPERVESYKDFREESKTLEIFLSTVKDMQSDHLVILREKARLMRAFLLVETKRVKHIEDLKKSVSYNYNLLDQEELDSLRF